MMQFPPATVIQAVALLVALVAGGGIAAEPRAKAPPHGAAPQEVLPRPCGCSLPGMHNAMPMNHQCELALVADGFTRVWLSMHMRAEWSIISEH
jgi:hypothetical protein